MGHNSRFLSKVSSLVESPGALDNAVTEMTRITEAVDPGDVVRVENRNGDVEVTAEDRTNVDVEATKKARTAADLERVSVEVTREDGVLLVETTRDDRAWSSDGVSVNLRIRVPSETRVASVATAWGDIAVTGTTGDLSASAGSGDVTLDGVDGTVDAHAGSGDVTVTDATRVGRVSAASGDITVRGAASVDRVEAASGDVRVESVTAVGRAEIASGDLTVAFREVRDSTTLTSSSGDVRVRAPSSVSATFALTTVTGDSEVRGAPGQVLDEARAGGARTVNSNGGGASVRVETASGDIAVSFDDAGET